MAGQKFTLTFDANLEVGKLKGALSEIQKNLNNLQLPQGVTKNLQGTFQKLADEVRNFEAQASKDITGKADFAKLEKSADRINTLFEKLRIQIKDIGNLSGKDLQKLLPDDVTKNITSANNALKTYGNTLKTIQSNIDKVNKTIAEQQNKLKSYQATIQQLSSSKSTKVYDSLKTSVQNPDGSSRFETEAEVLDRLKKAYEGVQSALDTYQKKVGENPTAGQQTYITRLTNQVQRLKTAYDNLQTEGINNSKIDSDIKTLETSAKAAQTQITKLTVDLQTLLQGKSGQEAQALQTLLNALQQIQGIDFSKFSQDAQGAGQAVQQYLNQNLQQLISSLQAAGGAFGQQTPVIQNFIDQIRQASADLLNFNNRMREVEMLKSRIQYFFGLNNTIQLFKHTVRSAYETIKSLDKAMTETAVVTNFSVGDMWAQLPEYTKRANELGVTTQAAYEAATLYYQQGLKTNEVVAMSNETLRMARIAGLDAAEATDRMTNAIRGFNMEINETSAQRIDDVYSRLAAISASNVDEISTAMTKVASLANSAGMEFETTAAFLAQIIETTRESAETAGTALKTVVARFSEVKSLYDEGELKGQDEEGEIIDVNRVSQALRVAGIDLNKFFLGEVGIDDIFMELASKWDSLTTLQQRYIATQAAGSRQQSRFIALMSDYARTQELVEEAYNANGAAAKQFEKTQESLESKLAKLKNAWNEFAMGIANSDVIKDAVDLLTNILKAVNSLTSGFGTLNSGVGGFINTFAKLTVLLGGLKVAKGLTTGLFGSMIGAMAGKNLGFNTMAANAMGVTAGKNIFGTLGRGFISPFVGIGKLGSKAWGGLKSLGETKALLAMDGGKGLSTKLAGGLVAKLTGAGMAEGGALGLAGITSLLTAIVGIGAAGLAAYGIVKKLYNLTPQGQVKIAEKYAKALSNVAAVAQSAADDIKKTSEEYSQYDDAVDNAATSRERSTAIQARNEYITSLLEQNAAYAEYLHTAIGDDGEITLTLDSEALAKAVDEIAKNAARANAYSEIGEAILKGQQANLFRSYQELASVDYDYSLIGAREGVISKGITTEQQLLIDRYKVSADKFESQMRLQLEQALPKLMNTNILSDEITLAIAHIIGNGFDAAKIQSEVHKQKWADWWASNATEDKLRAFYTDLYGADPGDLEKSELATSVAFAEVMQNGIESQIADFQKILTGNNKSLYEQIILAASGQGKINSINLSGIDLSGDNPEELFNALGFDSDIINKLNSDLNLAEGTLRKYIIAQAKVIQEIQKSNINEIFEGIKKSGVNLTDEIQALINQLTPETTGQLSELMTSSQGVVSEGYLPKVIDLLLNSAATDSLDEVQELFDSINLDKPIKAFVTLSRAEKQASDELKPYIDLIQRSNADLFSTSGLIGAFLTSEDSDKIFEDLEDLISDGEKISRTNIEELAKKYSDLDVIIKQVGVSTKALAKGFQLIAEGKIQVTDLNDKFVNLLENTWSFEEILDDISQLMQDFDAGRDTGEGIDFLNDKLEELGKLVNNFEFGNERTEKLYDLFFGEGSFMQAWSQDQTGEGITKNVEMLQSMLENDAYGFFSNEAVAATLGIDVLGNGRLNWNIPEDATYDSLLQSIQQLGEDLFGQSFSEDAAKILLAAFKTHAEYDTKVRLDELDRQSFLDGLIKSYADSSGKVTLTEDQLKALAATAGIDPDDLRKQLSDYLGDLFKVIIPNDISDFPKGPTGTTGGELIGKVEKAVTEEAESNPATVEVPTNVVAEIHEVDAEKVAEEIKDPIEKELPGQNVEITSLEVTLMEGYSLDFPQAQVVAQAIAAMITNAEGGIDVTISQIAAMLADGSLGVKLTDTNGNELTEAQLTQMLSEQLKAKTSTLQSSVPSVELSLTPPDNLPSQVANMIALIQAAIDAQKSPIIGVETQVNPGGVSAQPQLVHTPSKPLPAEVSAYGQIAEDQASATSFMVESSSTIESASRVIETASVDIDSATENLTQTADTELAAEQARLEESRANAAAARANYDAAQTFSSAFHNALAVVGGLGAMALGSGGMLKPEFMATRAKGGSISSPTTGLTGEEAPEIVWNKQKGYSYITGLNGPEFRQLQPGDQVFDAEETKKILRNSRSVLSLGSFAGGAHARWGPGDSNNSSSGPGSSSSDSDQDKWKNELDWLYNLVEDIAELERIQTKLQEEYDDYLKDQSKNGRDLYNLLIKQLGNLYTQLDHQTFALEQREREMREFMDTTNKYDEYLSYNWQDRTLEIDWDAIEALQDKDTYEEIKELVSEAESIQDKMDDAEDSVQDIRNQIEELENIWRDTYVDFEERVLDALVKSYQTVIDNYSELNDTLNNSNSEILSALQKQISLERQIRDNTKTEQDIADQEARLAFLRRDTTGSNELSALQLSSQLDESREAYEDNLIDQAIAKLQEDNDEAAAQRQKQIEIMQAQLDYQSENGEFNAAVRELLESAMDSDGKLLTDSELYRLLQSQENWQAMSEVSKQVWEEELQGTFKEVAAFILKQNAQENGTYITALTAAITSISSTIGSYSQALTKMSTGSRSSSSSSSSSSNSNYSSSSSNSSNGKNGWYDDGHGNIQYYENGKPVGREIQGTVNANGQQAPTSINTRNSEYTVNGITYKKRGNTWVKAIKGGLFDTTGLMQIDGTASEPEYVLNARQTDAFLRLADILPSMMQNGGVTNATTFGGINLNLVMNVDQIASDYDVDRIADRVKSIIYDAGSYRNVNTLNFSR